MKEPKNIVESMFLEEKKQSSEYNSNCPQKRMDTAGTGRPYGMPSSDN
jgi:hypothetical protein